MQVDLAVIPQGASLEVTLRVVPQGVDEYRQALRHCHGGQPLLAPQSDGALLYRKALPDGALSAALLDRLQRCRALSQLLVTVAMLQLDALFSDLQQGDSIGPCVFHFGSDRVH